MAVHIPKSSLTHLMQKCVCDPVRWVYGKDPGLLGVGEGVEGQGFLGKSVVLVPWRL